MTIKIEVVQDLSALKAIKGRIPKARTASIRRMGERTLDILLNKLMIHSYPPASNALEIPAIRTGTLKNSIKLSGATSNLSESRITISANASYANFLEYGTQYMHPRPFLRPAVAEAMSLTRDHATYFIKRIW